MFDHILELPRVTKRIITLCIDSLIIFVAFFGSFFIRYDSVNVIYSSSHWIIFFVLLVCTLVSFIKLGLYRAVLRFITIKIVKVVALGAFISSIVLLLTFYFFQLQLPRTILFLYFILLSLLVTGIRLFFRAIFNTQKNKENTVIIYGAGSSGRQLLTALNQISNYFAIAFVDDDKSLHKAIIHGITIYSPDKIPQLIERYNVKKVLLAMPNAPIHQRKKIISNLSEFSVEVLSVPSIDDIVSGKMKLTTLNKVSITDLLGRDPVEPNKELLAANIVNKTVMVTGAGGSIGSELCRQIIKHKPTKLILFEVSEFNLYAIEQELTNNIKQNKLEIVIIPIIGTIQNKEHLYKVMNTFSVQTIYHAAAYKHVPLVEYNVIEGVKNNILGTLYCAESAIKANVETFVLISTDRKSVV